MFYYENIFKSLDYTAVHIIIIKSINIFHYITTTMCQNGKSNFFLYMLWWIFLQYFLFLQTLKNFTQNQIFDF